MQQRLVQVASACPWISNLAMDEWALGCWPVGMRMQAERNFRVPKALSWHTRRPATSLSSLVWFSTVWWSVLTRTYSAARFALAMMEFPRFQSNALSSIRHSSTEEHIRNRAFTSSDQGPDAG